MVDLRFWHQERRDTNKCYYIKFSRILPRVPAEMDGERVKHYTLRLFGPVKRIQDGE